MKFEDFYKLYDECDFILLEKGKINYRTIKSKGIIKSMILNEEDDENPYIVFWGIKDKSEELDIVCLIECDDNLTNVTYDIETNTLLLNRVKVNNTVYVYEMVKENNKPALNIIKRISTCNNESQRAINIVNYMNKYFNVNNLFVEHGYLLSYTDKGELKSVIQMSQGTSINCLLPIREIFIALLLSGARTFQYIHNHPEGSAYPSKGDINCTNTMIQVASLLDMDFDDHIIIGDDGYYSFKEEEDTECKVD